jgi:hypothetical protein
MTSTRIVVSRSRSDQGDLRHPEHASVAPDLMRALGLDLGQQVIIRRDEDTFALYTLTDAGPEPRSDIVRMGRIARARLAGQDAEQFVGSIDPIAVDPTATQEQARKGEKLLERLDDDGRHRA